MRTSRLTTILALLGLLLGGLLTQAPATRAAGPWTPSAPLGLARAVPSATLLPDGQVLVVGGITSDGVTATAERYDPRADRWIPAAPLTLARMGHTALPLPGGQVFVFGGSGATAAEDTSTAELYDPATDRWASPAHPLGPHGDATLTVLPGGRVLLVGGAVPTDYSRPATAELYDPVTNRWTPAAAPRLIRGQHRAVALPDGAVLAVGHDYGPTTATALNGVAERYDPAADRWMPTGPKASPAIDQATPLANGQVLVTGGATQRPGCTSHCGTLSPAAERYDPATNAWVRAADMHRPRINHDARPLPDGTVLVTSPPVYGTDTPEVYDPIGDRWTSTGPRTAPDVGQFVTLADGRPLFVGATRAEVYDPPTATWVAVAPPGTIRLFPTATRLADGRVLLVGGRQGADQGGGGTPVATGELYAAGIPTACFRETGQCLRGRFLDYWQAHGGLAINGYPLAEERQELLEDGGTYTVQYLERVRLEYHPENAPPYDVLLGQFGRRVLETESWRTGDRSQSPAPDRTPGARYFPETGRYLSGRFLDSWEANGGLAQFGLPLTEVFETTLEDGARYRVQYFERARFEAHPEHAAPYDVLLGQFGRTVLAANDLLATDPGFRSLYLGYWPVRFRLGDPTTPTARAPGAYQRFERGALIYRGDTRRIYVIRDDGRWFTTPNTWREGEPAGGGAGPGPGLYIPRLGFYKLWSENTAVREYLGYATDPDETAYTLRAQEFARGGLVSATTPRERIIYILSGGGDDASNFYAPDPAPLP